MVVCHGSPSKLIQGVIFIGTLEIALTTSLLGKKSEIMYYDLVSNIFNSFIKAANWYLIFCSLHQLIR